MDDKVAAHLGSWEVGKEDEIERIDLIFLPYYYFYYIIISTILLFLLYYYFYYIIISNILLILNILVIGR